MNTRNGGKRKAEAGQPSAGGADTHDGAPTLLPEEQELVVGQLEKLLNRVQGRPPTKKHLSLLVHEYLRCVTRKVEICRLLTPARRPSRP
jgi:hypothetical protein